MFQNSNKHKRLIRMTERLLAHSTHHYQMAAVVANGSRVVGFGVNSYRSHPKSKNSYTGLCSSTHAEIDAILSTPEHLREGSVIYVLRRIRSGKLAMAKPCPCCKAFLQAAGIKSVVYSNVQGEITFIDYRSK